MLERRFRLEFSLVSMISLTYECNVCSTRSIGVDERMFMVVQGGGELVAYNEEGRDTVLGGRSV